jgi:hypothetical protein
MGSEDLIDCQEGNRKFPNYQEGRGKKMRLCESLMSSEMSSHQPEELIREDQKGILMIGGIQIFLPDSPVEARACVAEGATAERQPAVTVGELEKIFEAAQVKEEEVEQTLMFSQGEGDENSEEWLKIFSQEAEKEITVVLEAAEEEEEEEEANNIDFLICVKS